MADTSTPRHPAKSRKRDAPAATAPEPAPVPETAPEQPPAAPPTDAPDRLDEALVQALQVDFAEHGAKAIAAMRTEKPTEYVKIIVALRAKTPTDPADSLREMSDAELDRAIHDIAARAGLEIRPLDAARREGAAGDDGAAAG